MKWEGFIKIINAYTHTGRERIRKSSKEFIKATLKIPSHSFLLGRFPLKFFQKILSPPAPLPTVSFCKFCLPGIIQSTFLVPVNGENTQSSKYWYWQIKQDFFLRFLAHKNMSPEEMSVEN